MTDGPGNRTPAGKRFAGVYQGSVEAVVALLLAMGLGHWADGKFETAPILLLVGVVIGFGAFVLRLMRMRPLVEAAAAAAPKSTKRWEDWDEEDREESEETR
jgi:F0F1-type ATP synthase assembly protein I